MIEKQEAVLICFMCHRKIREGEGPCFGFYFLGKELVI
jgi:hypothetical protein